MLLKGSFPTLITPLTEKAEIDYFSLTKLVEMHNIHSDGLVLFSSSGEGWLIPNEDKRFILKHVQSVFEKKIIVNIPCWSPKDCARIIQNYQGLTNRIDGFLITAPPYLKLDPEQVFYFFNSCISYLENKAIICHNPARNQVTFTPQISNWIQNDSRIIGVKETVREHLSRYIDSPGWTVFAGEDIFLRSQLYRSSMNVGGNLFPELFSKTQHSFSWSQWSELLALGPNPVIIKALLYLEGLLQSPSCFDPIGPPSEARLAIIKKHYQHFKRSTLSSLQFINDLDS